MVGPQLQCISQQMTSRQYGNQSRSAATATKFYDSAWLDFNTSAPQIDGCSADIDHDVTHMVKHTVPTWTSTTMDCNLFAYV